MKNTFASKLGVAAIALSAVMAAVPAYAQTATTTTSTSSYQFAKNLTLGSTGADVKALQQFLNANSYTVATSGAGSVGNETTYFGKATKAALAKYQAAKGITPAVGYFGPLTRASVNATGSTTGTTTGSTTGSTTTTPVTTPSAAKLSVSLASDNAASANVQKGSANNSVLKLTLTGAADKAVTVTGLTLKSYGTVVATGTADVTAVKLFDENGIQLGSNRTQAGNQVNFVVVPGLVIPANGSRTVTVTTDIATATTNVMAVVRYGLDAATAVIADSTFTGTFPVLGNSFTIVPAGQLGTASVSVFGTLPKSSAKTGEKDIVVARFNVSAGSNEDVSVNQVTLSTDTANTVTGNDISGLRLRKVNSTEVLSTASLVNNKITFNLANPVSLTRGASANLEVVTDIAGDQNSNGKIVDLKILAGGVIARGATSGTNVTSTGEAAFSNVQIGTETLSIAMSASHPQGSAALIIKTTNKKDLAKFDVRAVGGATILNTVDLKFTNTDTGTLSSVGLYDGDSLVSDLKDVTVINGTTAAQQFSLNWTVPANTTKVLTVKGITNGLNIVTSVSLSVTWNATTGYGLSSGATINNVTVAAATAMTVYSAGTATFAADQNKTPRSQGVLAPVNNVVLAAVQARAQREDLKLDSIKVTLSAADQLSSITLYADDGVTQLSNPINVVALATTATIASGDYLSDIVFPKDTNKTILVKGNVLSTATNASFILSIANGDIDMVGQDSGQAAASGAVTLTVISPAAGTYSFDTHIAEISKAADAPSGSVNRSNNIYAIWDVKNVSSDLADLVISKIKLTSKSGLPNGLNDLADEVMFKLTDEVGNPVFTGDAAKDTLNKAAGTIEFGTTYDAARLLTVKVGEVKKLKLSIIVTDAGKWPSNQTMQWSIEAVGDVVVEQSGTSNGLQDVATDGYVGYGSNWTIGSAVQNTVTLP